jgi:hypothetical protein
VFCLGFRIGKTVKWFSGISGWQEIQLAVQNSENLKIVRGVGDDEYDEGGEQAGLSRATLEISSEVSSKFTLRTHKS